MPVIRNYATTIYRVATASMVCVMPTHETGDLLVAVVSKDDIGAFTTPSGWTAQAATVSAGAAGGIYLKRATSSAETVTFTLTSNECMALVISVKGCNGTTVAHAVSASAASGADDATVPYTGVGVTPAHDNTLIIHGLFTDLSMAPTAYPGWVNILPAHSSANSLCVSYNRQVTAGAIAAPNHWAFKSAEDTRGVIVAIRDDGNNSAVDPYIAPGTTPSVQLAPLYVRVAPDTPSNKGTWKAATPNDITSIGGKTTGYALAVNVQDAGYNPYAHAGRVTVANSTTNLTASEITFSSFPDLTAGLGVIFGTWRFQATNHLLFVNTPANGGVMVGVADANNYGRFWAIGGALSKTTYGDSRMNYAVEVANAATAFATINTPALNAINDFYVVGGCSFADIGIEVSELYLLYETILAGGTAGVPLNANDLEMVINEGNGHLPLFKRSGSSATLWTALRFGGVDPINVDVKLFAFQFPKLADNLYYTDFHVRNNKIGIEFYGIYPDTFNFTNCLFTSESSYYFRFNASHESITMDFSGSSIINASVTLQESVSLTSVSFVSCSSFTQNSATLSKCNFNSTKITSNRPELISDCVFKSAGTGHAIEVTSVNFSTVSFLGNTFSGYAAGNGSTGNEAVYVNIAVGTITFNITGTAPSIRTAGATIILNRSRTLTLTGLVFFSDIVITTSGTNTALENIDQNYGNTYVYTYSYVPDTYINIRIMIEGYLPYVIYNYLLPDADAFLPIAQSFDRNFQ